MMMTMTTMMMMKIMIMNEYNGIENLKWLYYDDEDDDNDCDDDHCHIITSSFLVLVTHMAHAFFTLLF